MAQAKTIPVDAKASAAEDERQIGILPEIYKGKGLGGKEQYNVIITDKSIIFALITPAVIGPAAKVYAKRTTAEILTENKKNFSINRSEIKSFNFKPGHSYMDCCRKLQEIDGELTIITLKSKHTFSAPFRRTDIAKDVLKRAGLYSPEAAKPESEDYPAEGS